MTAGEAFAAYRAELQDIIRRYRSDWRNDAACNGLNPDLFFPAQGHSTRVAKQICASCPVRIECLAYALENNEPDGVWGGLDEGERRRVRRRRELPT